MQNPLDELYPRTRERVNAWIQDPEVLGIVWVGSRSRGYGDAMSDDDLEVYMTPEAFSRIEPADTFVLEVDPVAEPRRYIYDVKLSELSDLEAKTASTRDVDHWPYEQAPIVFDRDGRVTAAVQAAAAMAPAFRRLRIQYGALDAVLAVNRARKTDKRGFRAATGIMVANGARALARALFALEGRWAPLNHWLEPELATLADPVGAGKLLIEAVVTGSHRPLEAALELLQPRLEAEGFPPRSDLGKFHTEVLHPDRAAERAVHSLA